MQTDDANDEQSPDQGNRKVMGESEHLQTDASGRNTANRLGMSDLQRNSEDPQLQQELEHLSLTEEFEKGDLNSDRWESMLNAVQEGLDRPTSSLAPATTRIEKL